MKWDLIESKKRIIIAHLAIILAVLGSSEPFDNVDFSLWIMIIAFVLLLICYFIFRATKLEYIPKFHILIAFCVLLFWVAALFTCEYWTNITGWDSLVYLFYPFIAGIFAGCMLFMNLGVFIAKKWGYRMNKSTVVVLVIGVSLACVCYIACSFFLGSLAAALLALIVGIAYFSVKIRRN